MTVSNTMTSANVVARCDTLKKYWGERNRRFKDWYEQIQMIDRLAQKNMESFVGNDPRAAFNLILSVLDQKIPHRIKPENLTMEETIPAAELSANFEYIWSKVQNGYRQRGRYFMRDLIGFLISTGWYSVFSLISVDGSTCITEPWNPATVFPIWDDTLTECPHIWSLSSSQAKRLATRNHWEFSTNMDRATCYDYWWLDDGGKVHNAVVLGNILVKPDTAELRLSRIPIYVSPIGGLPDTGEINIRRSDRWKGEIGQPPLATNENIYKSFDKWWTFVLQILRDTAQPRTYEKSAGTNRIVKPEDWDARGAHFKLGQQDELGYLNPPPMPGEIRSTQLDMEAMMQRGGPTWSQYGNVSSGMTAYVMSQVVASTNNTAKPFHRGIIDCISDIDNSWAYQMKEFGYKPYGRTLPAGLPEDFEISAEYELRIPGDLTQRATNARMLNPDFTLSEERIMEWDFPEIRNPAEEIARRDAGTARRDPVFAAINLVQALRDEANLLRRAKDLEAAELYEKVANAREQQLMGQQQPQQGGSQLPYGNRPEAVPPQGAAPPMNTTGQ